MREICVAGGAAGGANSFLKVLKRIIRATRKRQAICRKTFERAYQALHKTNLPRSDWQYIADNLRGAEGYLESPRGYVWGYSPKAALWHLLQALRRFKSRNATPRVKSIGR